MAKQNKSFHRCPMCDEWYDPHGVMAAIHEHREPQSGPFRDHWLASGLSYERWIKETVPGNDWDHGCDAIRRGLSQ